MRIAAAVVGGALALAGCMMQTDVHGVTVTPADLGDRWPLTVPSGVVRCEWKHEITFQWRGTTYTLTGEARDGAYSGIEPIHVKGKDLGPLIALGQARCT